jgi:hypothetical protein
MVRIPLCILILKILALTGEPHQFASQRNSNTATFITKLSFNNSSIEILELGTCIESRNTICQNETSFWTNSPQSSSKQPHPVFVIQVEVSCMLKNRPDRPAIRHTHPDSFNLFEQFTGHVTFSSKTSRTVSNRPVMEHLNRESRMRIQSCEDRVSASSRSNWSEHS